jgi:hypothetical protein
VSRDEVLRAIEDYESDADFRAELKANAQQAMRKRNYSLTGLEREILEKIDWSWSTEQVNVGKSWIRQQPTAQSEWQEALDNLSERFDTYWANWSAGQPPSSTQMLWI